MNSKTLRQIIWIFYLAQIASSASSRDEQVHLPLEPQSGSKVIWPRKENKWKTKQLFVLMIAEHSIHIVNLKNELVFQLLMVSFDSLF